MLDKSKPKSIMIKQLFIQCKHTQQQFIHSFVLLQRGGIACNADRCNTYSNSVCPSVCPSVTHWYPIQTNEHRITRSSL